MPYLASGPHHPFFSSLHIDGPPAGSLERNIPEPIQPTSPFDLDFLAPR